MTTTAVDATYSADELRVLAMLTGAILPPAVEPAWSADDTTATMVVAARGLLARGALIPGAPATGASEPAAGWPEPTGALRTLLAPLREATTVVELTRTDPAGTVGRTVLAGSDTTVPHACTAFVEREPDIWVTHRWPEPIAQAATTMLLDTLDDLIATGPAADPDGEEPVGSGVRYSIRIARRLGESGWELGYASWLDAGVDGGLWRWAGAGADGQDPRSADAGGEDAVGGDGVGGDGVRARWEAVEVGGLRDELVGLLVGAEGAR